MTVYWMGGSPCAGKTTISDIIAQEFDWHIYHIDRHIESYLQRADEKQHPHLSFYKKIGLKQFLLLEPERQLEKVLGMSHEQFAFILEDIAVLHEDLGDKPILVEGANILAADVMSQVKTPDQVIWLVPTEDFLLETYPTRGSWVQDVLRHHYEAKEGILAFERWMERDARMADWTAQQANQHGIHVIVVDGETPLLDNAELVMKHFGLLSSA